MCDLPDVEPVVPFSGFPTSGRLGGELDLATGSPATMSDADLVEAVVGFEHPASWAGARQPALLAGFARRRPADDAEAARPETACAVSRELGRCVGVWPTATGRVGRRCCRSRSITLWRPTR